MKRKMLFFLLTVLAAICCALAFSACGDDKDNADKTHRHELTLVAENGATCTKDGNSAYYTCNGCDKWFSDEAGKNEIRDKSSVVILKGHKLTSVAEEKATCAKDGNSAYYTCDNCGKWFSDEAGENEITDKTQVVLLKGHKLTPVKEKEPTCEEEGNSAYYTCSGCDKWFSDEEGKEEIADKANVKKEKIAHSLTHIPAVKPECMKNGNTEYYSCEVCKSFFEDSEGKNPITDKDSVILKKTGHDFSVAEFCIVCGTHCPTEGLAYTVIDDHCEVKKGTATATEIYIAEEYEGKPVTSIGNGAFWNYVNMTKITLPDSITYIGERAFFQCTNLTFINLPEGLTTISSMAFEVCSKLEKLTIPDSVVSIGSDAFNGCNNKLVQTENGVRYVDKWAVSCATSVTEVVIKDGTTGVADFAFHECKSMTAVTIPDSVKYIGGSAFIDCSSLISVSFPDSVKNIGRFVFARCTNLKSVKLPTGITSINYGLFQNCSSLTEVIISNSVTSIGDRAFYYCTSLTDINLNGTKEQWEAIVKAANWNYNTGNYTVHCTDGDLKK